MTFFDFAFSSDGAAPVRRAVPTAFFIKLLLDFEVKSDIVMYGFGKTLGSYDICISDKLSLFF